MSAIFVNMHSIQLTYVVSSRFIINPEKSINILLGTFQLFIKFVWMTNRPIAAGIIWRRLTGKISCSDVKESLVNKLKPFQLGAEALVHAVRRFCESDHVEPVAIIKFDFRNAFNMIFRNFMLGEVKEICPELLSLPQQAYRCSSNLYFGDEPLFSERGFQ